MRCWREGFKKGAGHSQQSSPWGKVGPTTPQRRRAAAAAAGSGSSGSGSGGGGVVCGSEASEGFWW